LNLISRYIFREALGSSLLVMGVLLVILMSNQFALILNEAATDALPRETVFVVFGLTAIGYVTLIAPIALLLGLLLALARLNRDSEMAALSACGVGPGRLLIPIGALSLAAAAGVGWLALMEAPAAARAVDEIKYEAREEMELSALKPGSFTTPDGGRTVLYARETAGDLAQGVFMQRQEDGRIVLFLAEEGQRVQDPATGEISLRLRNGRRYDGVPGEADFFVAEFGEGLIPIRSDVEEFEEDIAARPTVDLLGSRLPDEQSELQWRIAAPLSMLLLALLAVPLSRSSPREGRFARVGVGLLVYVIYANMLAIAGIWIEREILPAWLGLWSVHGLLAIFAVTLLLKQSGVLARSRRFAYHLGNRHEPTA
jgi:lipopolysaccharide export system permease protein